MGILSVSAGLQILGGYGYCDEFPLEQYYRDMRIHPIHEGTTGIQAMDLLGRKVVMKNGRL
jgi:alkylation response protein AidB-like acyl-CoA dehydrogenase